jgi:hypothetical protein
MVDEEDALSGGDGVYDEEVEGSEYENEDYESYDGDVDRERIDKLERQTSHMEALQLGRRASHDTTL